MKAGDIFYSVMQKDNSPFEKPRIVKFMVKEIDNDCSYPIVSLKQDRWGRYYRFKESQIYLTYEEALVEKSKIIEKIKSWETEKAERDKAYFEEQERKEQQRQLDHDKQVRKEVCNDFKSRFLATYQIEKGCDTASFSLEVLNRILDQIETTEKI